MIAEGRSCLSKVKGSNLYSSLSGRSGGVTLTITKGQSVQVCDWFERHAAFYDIQSLC